MGWVCWGGRNWCMEEKVDKSWLSTRGWPAADLDTTPKSKYTNRVSAASAREGGGGVKYERNRNGIQHCKAKVSHSMKEPGSANLPSTRQTIFWNLDKLTAITNGWLEKKGSFSPTSHLFFCFVPSSSLVRFHSRRPIRISKLCPCESYTIAMLSVCTVWCTFCAILIVHHCTGSIIARLGL